jgi:hypothetical protein
MTQGSGPLNPVQPLTVGNVVSAGFRLYGAKFKDYLTIAFFGTLWILLPFVAAFAIAAFFAVVQNYYALLGLLIPALIVLLLFASAKYAANSALIARLAFGELTNQPEPLSDARRYTNSRKWSFLLTGFLMFLIYFGVLLAFYLVLAILLISLFGVAGFQLLQNSAASPPNAGLILLFALLVLVLLVGFLVFYIWLTARFIAPELPMAVEPGVTATQTIGRFWALSRGYGWRIALIAVITFCITIPLQILAQVLASLPEGILKAMGLDPQSASYIVLLMLITYILSFALSILVLPLWQVIKAVIYYDLRTRQEGLGLQLRDREV